MSPDVQVALVTGGIMGIGYHVAGSLAKLGYHVIIADRAADKKEETLQQMAKEYGGTIKVDVEFLDLSSLASVGEFAESFLKRYKKLDVLVCNAGIAAASAPTDPDKQLTKDGVNVLYQINFLGHFQLILSLMPLLQQAKGRVVQMSSSFHRTGEPAHLALVRKVNDPYVGFYGFTKLTQIALSFELTRRFGETGVAFHAVNPGGVASTLWHAYPAWQRCILHSVLINTATAAKVAVHACTTEEGTPPMATKYWNSYRGSSLCSTFEYWSPCGASWNFVLTDPSPAARDPAFQAKLWEESLAALTSAGIVVTPEGRIVIAQ